MRSPPSHVLPDRKLDRKDALAGEVIVLLEDDDLVCRATERMLRRFGAEVIIAGGSQEAIAIAAGRRLVPSCVIADYWLSGAESGLNAAAAVRESTKGALRGLIVTGDLSREVADNVAAAGFRLLRKPVAVEAYIDALTAPQ
jgi:ActR/RegA family two-component response regulator